MRLIPFILALASPVLLAEEAMPRKAENISLRNEIQLAINKGTAWLKKNQNPDGTWSSPEQPALTALPLQALVRDPSGKYREERPAFVEKGYARLLGYRQLDGGIYRKELSNYNTSLSLIALVAAEDPKFEPAIRAAREFVIGQQAKGLADPSLDGGIGYGPTGTDSQHPDLSNTLTALEALHSSKKNIPGVELASGKDLDWQAVTEFIQRCQNLPSHNKESWASDDPDNVGGFIYYPGNSKADEVELPNGKKALRSYGSMSYAGLLSYIYADLKKDDPRVQSAVVWLRRHYTLEENPGMGADGQYYYYHLMAKALATYGLQEFETADGKKVNWQKELALKLINLQKTDGSWSNDSGRWMEKDPVLVTSYSLLALEIIHRAL